MPVYWQLQNLKTYKGSFNLKQDVNKASAASQNHKKHELFGANTEQTQTKMWGVSWPLKYKERMAFPTDTSWPHSCIINSI